MLDAIAFAVWLCINTSSQCFLSVGPPTDINFEIVNESTVRMSWQRPAERIRGYKITIVPTTGKESKLPKKFLHKPGWKEMRKENKGDKNVVVYIKLSIMFLSPTCVLTISQIITMVKPYVGTNALF